MTNITAFLIVLTLTGTPAAGVACIAECRQAPATSGHCHEDTTTTDGPMIAASVSCYDPDVTESLYVVEHRALVGAAVLTGTSPVAAPAVARTGALTIARGSAQASLKPLLVLRI